MAGPRNRRSLAPLLGVTLGGLLALCPILALGNESGSSLEVKQEVFYDRNQVWNFTPAFGLKLALSRVWTLLWEQELDLVSGASRRLGSGNVGPLGNPDGVSGASKVEFRHSENPGLSYSHKGLVASASVYSSRENDYFSLSPAGSLSMDFFERNTTLGVSYAEFFDDYRPTGFFAGQGGKKRIQSTGVTLAQSITSLTLVGLTGSLVTSSGYLGHPYNPPLDSNGSMMVEILPDKKQAGALSFQVVQGYLAGERLGSINVEARRYQDSWGIKSNTCDLKLSQYISEGTYIRIRGRYYQQTGALFAKDKYTGRETFKTADVRFFPFSSWLGGLKLSAPFWEAWDKSAMLPDRWDVKFDYQWRDTHGDAVGQDTGPRGYRYQFYGEDEFYQQVVIMFGLVFNL